MNDLTRAAIAYLADGMHLLALHGKRPNPALHETWDWENSIHGLPESEEDERMLNAVLTHRNTTGIAILIPLHVLVADVDTEAAARLLIELAGDQDLAETRVSRTHNGLHVWFLAPGADASIWLRDRTLLFKGFGGYVVAPPSKHFTDDTVTEEDGVYTWIGDWRIIDWLPDGVEQAIRRTKAFDALESVAVQEPARRLVHSHAPDGHLIGWSEYALEGLCKAIREAPDGNQNNIIAWAAMQARDEGVPYEDAMRQLLAASIEGGHPEHRARTTIRGAYRRASRA